MHSEFTPEHPACPLAAALELIGDKWSLLIVRDMCMNKRKYGDFQQSAEAIPTNILANRLKGLEQKGIILKRPYQSKPLRYEYLLTPKGADLLPVIQQLAIWAYAHVPNSMAPPDWFLQARPEALLAAQTKSASEF